jgi:hypothetical protein
MADELANEAAQLAIQDAEEHLIQASRAYEDSRRANDSLSMGYAVRDYTAAKLHYDALTGGGQQQRQSGQLSNAQQNFLSRRAALGDDLTPARKRDYELALTRATNAGLTPDTPQYFAAIEKSVDTMGDGRQPLLDERSAAKICGVSDEVYAANAAKMRAMKSRGEIP